MEFLTVNIMMSFFALRNGHRVHLFSSNTFVQQPPPYSEGTQIWLLYLYNYCTSAQYGIEHNDLHQYLRRISMQFAKGSWWFPLFPVNKKSHFAVKTSKITRDRRTFRKILRFYGIFDGDVGTFIRKFSRTGPQMDTVFNQKMHVSENN